MIFSKDYETVCELQGKGVLQQACSSATFPSELKKVRVQLTGTLVKVRSQTAASFPLQAVPITTL